MEWWLLLLLIFGSFVVLMATGMPIAVSFLLICLAGVFLLFGEEGLRLFGFSLWRSLATFTLLPLPLFILMGEVILHSGVSTIMLDALDKWLGSTPGRLSLLAVGGGTLFATMTSASMGSIAMLGAVLVPEMERRGYKKPMTLGPILGSGGLAAMIPPSGLTILLCAIGLISIGKTLIAIIIPGLLMASLLATYIIIRCKLQPSLAPTYEVTGISLRAKLIAGVRYILPVGLVIFLVTGVIIMGIATPTEAAATGTLGTFILVALYGRLNWQVVKKAMAGSIQITVMMFLIIAGAITFSQILAMSGSSKGMLQLVMGLPLPPILILIAMQVVLLFLGMFMEVVSIMMITLPIFMPIVHNFGFDPVWFAVIYLVNVEIAIISPPFGLSLFVMKGVAPPDTTMGDIYKAALPFVCLYLLVIILVIAFPEIALWLPSMMR